MSGEKSIQMRSFKDKSCMVFNCDNDLINSGWMTERYWKKFRSNPKLDLKNFNKIVVKDNSCSFTRDQIHRSKRKVLNVIHSSKTDQYT